MTHLERGVHPLSWTKRQFQTAGNSILSYTKTILEKNSSHGKQVTREEAQWNWDGEVFREFGRDDPMRAFLLSQKSCPLIEAFWSLDPDKRTQEWIAEEKKDTAFWETSLHSLSAIQRESYPWAAVMEDVNGVLLVPHILLVPMSQISYKKFVKDVVIANAPLKIDIYRMKLLWSATVTNAYDYECKCKREAVLAEAEDVQMIEYRTLVKAATDSISAKRKRAGSAGTEDGSDTGYGIDITNGSDARLKQTKKSKHARKSRTYRSHKRQDKGKTLGSEPVSTPSNPLSDAAVIALSQRGKDTSESLKITLQLPKNKSETPKDAFQTSRNPSESPSATFPEQEYTIPPGINFGNCILKTRIRPLQPKMDGNNPEPSVTSRPSDSKAPIKGENQQSLPAEHIYVRAEPDKNSMPKKGGSSPILVLLDEEPAGKATPMTERKLQRTPHARPEHGYIAENGGLLPLLAGNTALMSDSEGEAEGLVPFVMDEKMSKGGLK